MFYAVSILSAFDIWPFLKNINKSNYWIYLVINAVIPHDIFNTINIYNWESNLIELFSLEIFWKKLAE